MKNKQTNIQRIMHSRIENHMRYFLISQVYNSVGSDVRMEVWAVDVIRFYNTNITNVLMNSDP